MNEIILKSKCTGCSACMNICPQYAIEMVEDEKGFKYPIIDKEKCIDCGLCKIVCPILKENNNNEVKLPKAFACLNKNEKERMNSSSGGIFILLAKEVIKNSGVVFGACFNSEFKVEHIKIENENEIYKLMGSKYVQSNINTTYREARNELEKGRYVLFSGTPCQIEGLKSYLRKEYENLYTVDLICHGVPSPLVWEKYKVYRKNKDKDVLKDIKFRDKMGGWTLYNIKFTYKNKEYRKNQNEDLFMQAFLKNTILRDSCYNCKFKKINRISDMTMGDYWGIDEVHPGINDNKGISLIMIHSSKGEEMFKAIQPNLQFMETDLMKALKYNPSMIESATCDKNREEFFKNLDKLEFNNLVNKYTAKNSILIRIKHKIKRVIKKCKIQK